MVSTRTQAAMKTANEKYQKTLEDAKIKAIIEWAGTVDRLAKQEGVPLSSIVEPSGLKRQTYYDRKRWVRERTENREEN